MAIGKWAFRFSPEVIFNISFFNERKCFKLLQLPKADLLRFQVES